MAVLHLLRHRGRRLTLGAPLLGALLIAGAGCDPGSGDASLRPDSLLRAELGLGDADRVHRVVLLWREAEAAEPDSVEVREGDWVEFVAGDWRVHELRFELDGPGGDRRAFLEASDQMASPPLVQRDQRFVVSFSGAPEGRYPFLAEGSGAAVRGVVVVVPRR